MSEETAPTSLQQDADLAQRVAAVREELHAEVGKVIVGQREVIDEVLVALLSGGHCLITGAPGLAKTLLVKTVAEVFDLSFSRIQFTPDLMPSDITGSELLEDGPEGKEIRFKEGPVFANMILADEINRTPPKTQSALLEAMQERQVTVAGRALALPVPFFVLATQNPIEMEGTYPLPEAQLDRFMVNVVIDYLSEDEEVQVVTQTTTDQEERPLTRFSGGDLLAFRGLVKRVPIAEDVARYAVRLAAGSRPGQPGSSEFVNKWLSWGAGTRAGQNLVLGAKTRALLDGRSHVSPNDVRQMAHSVLRHRLLVNYRAEAEGITVGQVIDHLLETVQAPS